MTAKEAYSIAKDGINLKKYVLLECTDFDEFYGFVFGVKDDENGTGYVCVDKLTGRRYEKSVAQDLSLLHRGVDIPLNEVV